VLVTSAAGWYLAAPISLRAAYDAFRARRLRQRYRVIDGGQPKRRTKEKFWN